MIPSVRQCFELMEQYRMLPNIRDHSLLVARVAGLMVEELCRSGMALSLELTVAGALLHDIAKTACLDCDGNHAAQGSEICRRHDYAEIAVIVAEHVLLQDDGLASACCREKEIVYYADKRVLHDQVVHLDQRLTYILARYGRNDQRLLGLIRENFARCRQVEERLFALLPWAPAELAGVVAGHAITVGGETF